MFGKNRIDEDVRLRFGAFMREFNRREWMVRIDRSKSFSTYARDSYEHRPEFGTGFVVDGQPVPYFHPNRSFHDEVIWLNKNLYYRKDVSFGNKLLNSAIVKFYGPSKTLEIITSGTGLDYIDFDRFHSDEEYARKTTTNIERAFLEKRQIWGTTELRTSLQKACRDYARKYPSVLDDRRPDPERKMRPSHMIHWVAGMSSDWISFFSKKPDMKGSFDYLTSFQGIGNYYGYHFSSNLARMPGLGAPDLIEAEYKNEFDSLGIEHGRIDENDDYVMAGPGAMATLRRLFPDTPINTRSAMGLLVSIRDNQEEFLEIEGESLRHLREASELGRFTTFGCEISCCQFNVFERLAVDSLKARQRARSPISREDGQSDPEGLEGLME